MKIVPLSYHPFACFHLEENSCLCLGSIKLSQLHLINTTLLKITSDLHVTKYHGHFPVPILPIQQHLTEPFTCSFLKCFLCSASQEFFTTLTTLPANTLATSAHAGCSSCLKVECPVAQSLPFFCFLLFSNHILNNCIWSCGINHHHQIPNLYLQPGSPS